MYHEVSKKNMQQKKEYHNKNQSVGNSKKECVIPKSLKLKKSQSKLLESNRNPPMDRTSDNRERGAKTSQSMSSSTYTNSINTECDNIVAKINDCSPGGDQQGQKDVKNRFSFKTFSLQSAELQKAQNEQHQLKKKSIKIKNKLKHKSVFDVKKGSSLSQQKYKYIDSHMNSTSPCGDAITAHKTMNTGQREQKYSQSSNSLKMKPVLNLKKSQKDVKPLKAKDTMKKKDIKIKNKTEHHRKRVTKSTPRFDDELKQIEYFIDNQVTIKLDSSTMQDLIEDSSRQSYSEYVQTCN